MVTRQRQIREFLLTESRPRHHWWIFDFLGFMMEMANNNWVYFPRIFGWFLEKYVKFTQYSRTKSTLVVQKLNTHDDTYDYSEILADTLKKLDETEDWIKPDTLN